MLSIIVSTCCYSLGEFYVVHTLSLYLQVSEYYMSKMIKALKALIYIGRTSSGSHGSEYNYTINKGAYEKLFKLIIFFAYIYNIIKYCK